MKDNPSAFKHLISPAVVEQIATDLKKVWAPFNDREFKKVSLKLKDLELKPRVHAIRDALYENLPKDFDKSIEILMKAFRKSQLSGFSLWPFTEFIQTYGLKHFDESLAALYEITQRFTSEFAIRPFIAQYPQKTYAVLLRWSKDPNTHVRRWTSEGTRPRLPWGMKLKNAISDPGKGIKILEELKFDDELYVRKSVANHLNDIAKDHPEKVVRLLKTWEKTASETDKKKIEWIKRQALRSLIKQGYKPALTLMGYGQKALIKTGKLKISGQNFKLNDNLNFEIELLSIGAKNQKIAIDYIIHYQKANKKLSPKVFKLKVVELKSQEKFILKKTHKLRPVTTRKHYSGPHRLEIQINGEIIASANWNLKI